MMTRGTTALASFCLLTASLVAVPAFAAETEWLGPNIVVPANGAHIGSPVLVRIGFPQLSERGPDEGTGIGGEKPGEGPPGYGFRHPYTPSDPKNGGPDFFHSNPPPPPKPPTEGGPAEDTGVAPNAAPRPRPVHFALFIDSPAPEPGNIVVADSRHLYFPAGLPQMIVALPPGPHQFQLVAIDRQGLVARFSRRIPPISVTVE